MDVSKGLIVVVPVTETGTTLILSVIIFRMIITMTISITICIIFVISISNMIIYQALTQAMSLLPSSGLWEWQTSDSEISVLVEIHKYTCTVTKTNCPRKYSSPVLHMSSSVQYWPEPGTLLAHKGAEEGGMLTMMMIAIYPARYLRQPPRLLIITIITGQHCHHHGHNLSGTNLSQILLLAPLGLACQLIIIIITVTVHYHHHHCYHHHHLRSADLSQVSLLAPLGLK